MTYYPYIKDVNIKDFDEMINFIKNHEKYHEYNGYIYFSNNCKLLNNPLKLTPEQEKIAFKLIFDKEDIISYEFGMAYDYIIEEFIGKTNYEYSITQLGRTGGYFVLVSYDKKTNNIIWEDTWIDVKDLIIDYEEELITFKDIQDIVRNLCLFDEYCKKLMDCLKKCAIDLSN